MIQDIEDFIMLEAFKGKTPEQIRKIVEADTNSRKKKKGKSKEEEEEEKLEEKKRKFLALMRPPYIWNFFEEGMDTPHHILRADADPAKCYADGRIESLMADITQLGFHLTKHEEQRWKMLVQYTLDIFKAQNQMELE